MSYYLSDQCKSLRPMGKGATTWKIPRIIDLWVWELAVTLYTGSLFGSETAYCAVATRFAQSKRVLGAAAAALEEPLQLHDR